MRLGVLDVGSNTVHLLVVDAHPGGQPLPAFSHKVDLRLAAHLEPDNTLSQAGEKRLTEVVVEALRIAEDKGVEDFLAFATSAVRDAGNGDEVLARVQERTGATIRVLTGENEARLTFLAARRWFGWSSGRLLVVDIGGGSLEIASRPGRGAGGGDVAAARRRAADQGLAHRRPAAAGRGARAAPARAGGDRQAGGASCAGAAPPTTRWARPRRSGSSPGSPGRRRRARAST